MTGQQKRRAERLESIRNAALSLIVEDGVDNFSIHRVAERLDLTVGALYRYYDSVDHLLSEVQVEILEGFDSFFDVVVDRLPDEDPLHTVASLLRAFFVLDELQPERFRLIARFVSTPTPVFEMEWAMRAAEPTMRLLGHLSDAIGVCQRQGVLSVGAAMDRSIIAWTTLQGVGERKKLARLSAQLFDIPRLEQEAYRTLLLGWGADPTVVEAILTQLPDTSFYKNALPAEEDRNV